MLVKSGEATRVVQQQGDTIITSTTGRCQIS